MRTEPKTHGLNQSPLYMLVKRSKLAQLLGISDAELRRLSKHSPTLYRERDIPKKKGDGVRHIENPERALKSAQYALTRMLGRITPPDYLYCPVKSRCYVTNAAQHKGHRVIRCLDIQKYFPSTPSRRVFWFFRTVMKCDRAIAGTLTRIACFNGHLPTGSPLSPIMSFFAHIDMWDSVASICKANGLTLTVYIDDVTISGDAISESVMWSIRQAIHKTGLRYHKEKAYVDRPGEVTGVVVSGERLIAPHRQFQKIRAANLALKTGLGGVAATKLRDQLVGLNGQMRQIQKQNA